MDNELTNLLPSERRRALSRDYLLRLGTLSALLVTLLVVVAGILLLPSYVFLVQSQEAKQARLATIETVLSSEDDASISARLVTISGEAAQLTALAKVQSASALTRAALAVSRPGVTLSGMEYSRANGTLTISGVAATRDALRTYQLALQSAPFAAAATLPVSSYAKDTNIEFIISVKLATL